MIDWSRFDAIRLNTFDTIVPPINYSLHILRTHTLIFLLHNAHFHLHFHFLHGRDSIATVENVPFNAGSRLHATSVSGTPALTTSAHNQTSDQGWPIWAFNILTTLRLNITKLSATFDQIACKFGPLSAVSAPIFANKYTLMTRLCAKRQGCVLFSALLLLPSAAGQNE